MSEESCVSYNLQIIKLILISLLLIFLKNSYFVVRIYSNLIFTYSKNLKGLFPTKAILYLFGDRTENQFDETEKIDCEINELKFILLSNF
jgi:hypothetical protein